MTLTEAIEAAREALNIGLTEDLPYNVGRINQALAALPPKPMTEDEITDILYAAWDNQMSASSTIRALKANNVLYVEETPISESEETK